MPQLLSYVNNCGIFKYDRNTSAYRCLLAGSKKAALQYFTAAARLLFYFSLISSYSLVPNPIFSACSRVSFQCTLGLLSRK